MGGREFQQFWANLVGKISVFPSLRLAHEKALAKVGLGPARAGKNGVAHLIAHQAQGIPVAYFGLPPVGGTAIVYFNVSYSRFGAEKPFPPVFGASFGWPGVARARHRQERALRRSLISLTRAPLDSAFTARASFYGHANEKHCRHATS